MSSVVRGSTTTWGRSRYGLASEAYRTRSIALWKTFSFPRSAMRSAFRSPGVPSIRETGTASLIGGASNRPMRAGFAESSLLDTTAPSHFSDLQYQLGRDTRYGARLRQLHEAGIALFACRRHGAWWMLIIDP